MRRVVVRADGGIKIGMGHVMRCLSLSQMIKDDFKIIFYLHKPDKEVIEIIQSFGFEAAEIADDSGSDADAVELLGHLKHNDIVLLDGYNFKSDYQKKIKGQGFKLICIDDIHAWHQHADVIINHADGVSEKDYSTEEYTKLYLGLDYLLLREDFFKLTERENKIQSFKKAFISMGAADINNISEKITNALLKVEGVDEIHLMLGVVNPHLSRLNKLKETYSEKVFMHFNLTAKQLIDLLQMCDGCICPASSISLEASAVGIGMISGYTAENQKGILRGLNKHKMAVDFGDFNLITESELIDKFTFLSKNIDLLQDCRVNQSTAIDRKSAIRIVQIFKNI